MCLQSFTKGKDRLFFISSFSKAFWTAGCQTNPTSFCADVFMKIFMQIMQLNAHRPRLTLSQCHVKIAVSFCSFLLNEPQLMRIWRRFRCRSWYLADQTMSLPPLSSSLLLFVAGLVKYGYVIWEEGHEKSSSKMILISSDLISHYGFWKQIHEKGKFAVAVDTHVWFLLGVWFIMNNSAPHWRNIFSI